MKIDWAAAIRMVSLWMGGCLCLFLAHACLIAREAWSFVGGGFGAVGLWLCVLGFKLEFDRITSLNE
jgi:hypothetical protein